MLSPNRAIDPQHSASVSASAGTGKTWLLVSRIIRLLLSGASPGSILAITFTRKAAAEMQYRLSERLLALASCSSSDLISQLNAIDAPTDSSTLAQARNLFEKILHCPQPPRITTFHAFCQDLLKRFPFEANVPPGFELTEQTTELEAEAWDMLVSEATQNPDSPVAKALEILFDYGSGLANTELSLANFLRHRSDWWAYTFGQQDPVKYASRQLQQQLQIEDDTDPCNSFFTDKIRPALEEFSDLLARHPGSTNNKFRDTLQQVNLLVSQQDYATAFELLISVFFTAENEPRVRKESKVQIQNMGAEGSSRFLALHETFCRQIADVMDIQAKLNTLAISCAWYTSGARLLHHYQTIKSEQRVLDFADLEWNAYLLLTEESNAAWVQYKLDARINHILIDEFQDTNPTQWQLLLPLLQELKASNSGRERSVFLVGDTKQSIYRFRRAQPRLFDIAQQWLGENLLAVNQTLDKSRRSSPAIMEFVNLVFGSGQLRNQIVHFDPHHTYLENYWGKVRVVPLFENDAQPLMKELETENTDSLPALRNPLLQARLIAEDERRNREAQFIAEEISGLVQQPIVIGEPANGRTANFSDIIILLRHRTHASYYEHALMKAGIPYIGTNKGTLLETLEIRDIVALLNLLVTPFNNLALAQVLKSPLFDFGDHELVALASLSDTNWINRLQKLLLLNPDDPKLSRAQQLLSRWQTLADKLPVHDLLDRIYHESNLIERYIAAYPEHLQHRVVSNLNRFIELALEIDSGRYPSIGRFLYRLRAMRESEQDAPDETPAGKSEARVRLLTVHAAKGLEAPIIFLADATNTSPNKDAYQAIVNWPAEQAQPGHFLVAAKKSDRDNLVKNLLELQIQESKREEANLLYVAVTRAKQLLYVTGCSAKRSSDLGWYGAITEQLENCSADAVSKNESGFIIDYGAMPAVVQKQKMVRTSATLEVEPALSHPLQNIIARKEISPSIAADESTESRIHYSDDDTSAKHEDLRLRGIIIHKMLQLIMERCEQLAVFHQLQHQHNLTDDQLQRYWKEVRELVATRELDYLFDNTHYDLAYNEVPVNFQHQDFNIAGIIDRLVVSNETVFIIDYKTHLTMNRTRQQELVESYRGQMSLYYEGVKLLWPNKQIRPQILFTRNAAIYDVDVISADEAIQLSN